MSVSGREEGKLEGAGRRNGRWWKFGSHFAWAASLFLTGLGAKFGLILAKGYPLPYHDQWPAEAWEMFVPYLSGKFSLATLFQPHNEHWVIFTRMTDLALLWLNGQWDSVLEMTCNAVIHCAGVAGFGWVMASMLGKRSWLVIWPSLVLILAAPFAWENTLWGYQSQFYFLLIFSWLTIWLLGLNRAWSARWWWGALTALFALFTVASGFLAAATVMALTGLMAWKERDWRRHVPTWVVCCVVMLIGVVLKYSLDVDYVDQVHSVGDLLVALGKGLAWPWVNLPWYAPINLFPLLMLAWMGFRSREPLKPAEWMIFGTAIWAGSQALAGAFARGNGGMGPAWRYMDSLSFVSVSGALAGYVLLKDYRGRLRSGALVGAGLAGWTLAGLWGLAVLTNRAWTDGIPVVVAEKEAQLKTARAWVATGDLKVLLAEPKDKKLAPLAAWLMREPHIRAVLPVCVRDPLVLAPMTNAAGAFVTNGWRFEGPNGFANAGRGSWSAQRAASKGTFESRPVSSRLPYLEVPVTGDLGAEGLSLELVELNGGKVTEIRPSSPPGNKWVDVDVKAPSGEFKVVAKDDSPTERFAFQEPRELGRWSYWARRWLRYWEWLVGIGVLGVLVNAVVVLRKNVASEIAPSP